MKHYRILLAVMMLALASLACQAITGGGDDAQNVPSGSTQPVTSPEDAATEPPASGDDSPTTETDFPMTDDAFNVMDVGDGSLEMSVDVQTAPLIGLEADA